MGGGGISIILRLELIQMVPDFELSQTKKKFRVLLKRYRVHVLLRDL